jgi:hypothetical protein
MFSARKPLHLTVNYRMDLLSLREDAQHLVERGQIKVGTAWYVSRLSPFQSRVDLPIEGDSGNGAARITRKTATHQRFAAEAARATAL